ncbi:MAG: hypothetical protein KF752_01570 [Pirellulaceae bacterium]|nr:hypothetical protein [Pirellulaceae bacterium]
MTTSNPATDSTSTKPPDGKSEPSLGPACMVIAILGLAVFAAVCGLGSWVVFSNQYPLAVKSIENQLIPWVETSQLSPEDKLSITQELETLVEKLKAQSIDRKQLGRLRNCLQDNPVLLWGGLQSMEHQAAGAGLTTTEQETLKRTCQRLLRMTAERKLGRTDLEFTIQELSEVRADGSVLDVRANLTAEQIRSFMKRAENLLVRNQISSEPYEQTPAQVFSSLLEAALSPAESP